MHHETYRNKFCKPDNATEEKLYNNLIFIYLILAESTQRCWNRKKYKCRPVMTLTLLLLFTGPFFLPAADNPDANALTIEFKINSPPKSTVCLIQILTKLRRAMFKQDGTGSL